MLYKTNCVNLSGVSTDKSTDRRAMVATLEYASIDTSLLTRDLPVAPVAPITRAFNPPLSPPTDIVDVYNFGFNVNWRGGSLLLEFCFTRNAAIITNNGPSNQVNACVCV